MGDIRDYIAENLRLSVRVWEAANLGFAATGAMIALVVAALASQWEFTIMNYGLRLLAIFLGTFLLVMIFVITPFRMWAAQKREVDNLTRFPERISFVDLAALAESDYEWTFGNDSFESLDFIRALRQAAGDEYLAIDGRRGCMNRTEDLKDFYLLERIPKDHLRDYQFDVPGFFHCTSNYDISTDTHVSTATKAERFRDLHVANKEKAIMWLQKHAAASKGRTAAAQQLSAERRERWEAERTMPNETKSRSRSHRE